MEEVKLFGMWRSPFSSRVEIALKLKGVQYEYIEEDLSNKSPQLLQYNPVHKKVPVLLHNGKPIAESLVILEYIDETWETNPLLPRDPYQKARARFWAKFIDDKCWPPLPIAYRSIGEEEQEKAREEACELLKFLESELKDKKFFGGDNIGLVDIAGSLIAFWVRVIQEFLGIDLLIKEKFPNLWNWAEELVNCSIVKETLPPKERVFESFRSRSTRV